MRRYYRHTRFGRRRVADLRMLLIVKGCLMIGFFTGFITTVFFQFFIRFSLRFFF